MPKSITFFSRGKTPIYVNYVIAHNNVGRPHRNMYDFPVRVLGESYKCNGPPFGTAPTTANG